MNLRHGIVLIVFLNLNSCGESEKENLNTFNEIKKSVILNYSDKKESFIKIKSYFALKHIKYIEFSDDEIEKIQYQIGNEIDPKELQQYNNKDFVSTDIKKVLALDSLTVEDLTKLKNELSVISADKLWIIDYYDAIRGKYTKEIDLRYAKSMNGLHFFYRIFKEPLDTMPNGSYNVLINNNTTGGVLADNVVWYYR